MAEEIELNEERLREIKEFSAKLYNALATQYWGDIDPHIFKMIATQTPKQLISSGEDIVGMITALNNALPAKN
jgi:hypothetical protein